MATSPDSLVSGLTNAHTQLAKIAELGGQLGVPLDKLDEFTETIGLLTMTTDLSAESAAMMTAQFANITGMSFDNVGRFGATIVDLGNNMATTESTVMEFAHRLAGVGVQAGMTEPDILAMGATLASLGLNAEAGSSAMTQLINKFIEAAGQAEKGGDAIDQFTDIMGISAEEFATMWKEDPVEAIDLFVQKLAELDPSVQISALDSMELSGLRVTDVIRRLGASQGLLTEATNLASAAWEENTALTDEAAKRAETSQSKFEGLKNRLYDVGITIGNEILPVITPLVEGFGEWLKNLVATNPELVQTAVGLGAIAIVAGPALSVLGTLVTVVGAIPGPLMLAGLAMAGLGAISGQAGPALDLAGEGISSIVSAVQAYSSGDTEGGMASLQNGLAKLAESAGLITLGAADNIAAFISNLAGWDYAGIENGLLRLGQGVLDAVHILEIAFDRLKTGLEEAFVDVRLAILQPLDDLIRGIESALSIDLGIDIEAQVHQLTIEKDQYELMRMFEDELFAGMETGEWTFSPAVAAEIQFDPENFRVSHAAGLSFYEAIQSVFESGDTAAYEVLLPLAPRFNLDTEAVGLAMYEELLAAGDVAGAMEFMINWDPYLEGDQNAMFEQMAAQVAAAAASSTAAAHMIADVTVRPGNVDISAVLARVQSQLATIGEASITSGGPALSRDIMGGGVPAFQGGGIMGETGMAFLHQDEMVLTPEQQRALGSARGGVTLHVENLYGQSPYELLEMLQRAVKSASAI